MNRLPWIAATTLLAAWANVATAGEKHAGMMMMPTMEQCQGGYNKIYKASMHWSKHAFKHACHKMMKHQAKMTKRMAKDKMTKQKM